MIILPSAVILALLILYQKKHQWKIGVISLLFFVYLGMGLSSILNYYFGITVSVFEISTEAMVYFSALLLLLLLSFFGFSEKTFQIITINNFKLYRILSVFLLLSSFGSIIFFMPFSINALRGDLEANRYAQINMLKLSEYGLINTYFSLVANFFIFNLVFGFLELSLNKKKNTIFGYFLVITSLSYYFYILAYVGRDGYVFWVMSTLFVFLFMRKFLSVKKQIEVTTLLVILYMILIIPFVQISDARFGSGQHSSASQEEENAVKGGEEAVLTELRDGDNRLFYLIENALSYTGQQVINFNTLYEINPPSRRGGENFPKIVMLLERAGLKISPIYNREELYDHFFEVGAVPWVFSTIIGSFVSDFGKYGAVLAVLIICLVNYFILYRYYKAEMLYVSDIMMFIISYQTVYWGIFYFRLYSANLYLICSIILVLIFRVSQNHPAKTFHALS